MGLVILFIFFSVPEMACGSITGYIHDLMRHPIVGVSVTYIHDGHSIESDTTDENGLFHIDQMGLGESQTQHEMITMQPGYPNPFIPQILLKFTIQEPGQLFVYNLLGQRVDHSSTLPPGTYQAVWGGLDGKGYARPAGIYFFRIVTKSSAVTRKVTMLNRGSSARLTVEHIPAQEEACRIPLSLELRFSHPDIADTSLALPCDDIGVPIAVTLNRRPRFHTACLDTQIILGDTLRVNLSTMVDNDSDTDFMVDDSRITLTSDSLLEFVSLIPGISIAILKAYDGIDPTLTDTMRIRITISPEQNYDVIVYGSTSAGVMTAIGIARMGRSVLLLSQDSHLGGMTSSGLGMTDIGNKVAIGGLAREFYQRVFNYYLQDSVWDYEERTDYSFASDWAADSTWWRFEPHVAEQVFRNMVAEAGISVVYDERLNFDDGVQKETNRIVSLVMESGLVVSGRMFIDATYEGDLMALSGVSYIVGREANSVYGETLNGVQTERAIYHQFDLPVDPYVIMGDTKSSLLPGIHPGGAGIEGSSDKRIQAYNFRLCLTDVPSNRQPFEKPADYDSLQYELLLRYYDAGFAKIPWLPAQMPNRKTDTNNAQAVSTDFIGMNYDYPDGDYSTRERIIRQHRVYVQGLLWTLANHPRVPEAIRTEVSRWGLAMDEFMDNDNWPRQLYVREARRMVSEYVMTEQNCRGLKLAPESVGLAAYGMDSHHTQRYVNQAGQVRNEGDVEVHGFPPYPISYRSLVPRENECGNLLVPTCLSASHIAYSSIRMEPVFMILGESAGIAAAIAVRDSITVQQVAYPSLREQLLANGQRLDPLENHIVGSQESQ
ncbi:MAG: FAD-dependent oxidoreductase [Fidelibacterota bacterium]|nr:MAG: FAD-dependent oxidoreductase [Candidatus Neomarinimicrobiota bacterium]